VDTGPLNRHTHGYAEIVSHTDGVLVFMGERVLTDVAHLVVPHAQGQKSICNHWNSFGKIKSAE